MTRTCGKMGGKKAQENSTGWGHLIVWIIVLATLIILLLAYFVFSSTGKEILSNIKNIFRFA